MNLFVRYKLVTKFYNGDKYSHSDQGVEYSTIVNIPPCRYSELIEKVKEEISLSYPSEPYSHTYELRFSVEDIINLNKLSD